jgi:hypothetical protein
MEPFQTRGYFMMTTLKYIREVVPEPKRSAIMRQISPETIRFAETVKPTDWYPVTRNAEVLGAIVAANEGDEEAALKDLIGTGIFAAQEATNTFLKLLMKVLTPGLFAKKLPSLYQRDNSRGRVTVEADDRRLVCRIDDAAGYRHLGPVSMGWATYALEQMGKKLQDSKIHGWSLATPDPDTVSFELHWRT